MSETTSERRTGAAPGSVHLVEDEVPVRRSLALLLRLHGYAAHEYGSAEAYLSQAWPAQRPACALVDVHLPGMSGMELQARLALERRAPPVLLMTGEGDAALARRALAQGASDLLEKPIDGAELLAAVEAALQADRQRQAALREHEQAEQRLALLSLRERALFEAIADGRPLRELAARFATTLADIEAQRAALMDKLQVRRAAELCRLRLRLAAPAGAAPHPGEAALAPQAPGRRGPAATAS